MNILLVSYWSYPNTGAIDVYIRNLKAQLEQRGHKVDILARAPKWHNVRLLSETYGPEFDTLRNWSAVIPGLWGQWRDRIPSKWVIEREGEQYLYELGMLEVCDLGKYDLIHAHDIFSSHAISRLLRAPLPLVLTTHGLYSYEILTEGNIPGGKSTEWRYTFLKERDGINAADVSITPCEWMREEYSAVFGIDPAHMVAIPYGVDPDVFGASVAKDKGFAPESLIDEVREKTVLTCVARMVPLKGHRILIDALSELEDIHSELTCLLVGDGPLLEDIKALASKKALEGVVHFLGKRNDVHDILRVTDVFVLPSLQEITPIAITEAQIMGKPVIATDVGGVPDIVEHDVTGVIVDPGEAGPLAAAIRRLIGNHGLRARLGESARKAALAERTWDRHMERLLSTYELAITRKGPSERRRDS